MMYQIQATRNGVQLPTFYLDSDVCGFVAPTDITAASRVASHVLFDGTDCMDSAAFTVYEPNSGAYGAFTYAGSQLRRTDDGTVQP